MVTNLCYSKLSRVQALNRRPDQDMGPVPAMVIALNQGDFRRYLDDFFRGGYVGWVIRVVSTYEVEIA